MTTVTNGSPEERVAQRAAAENLEADDWVATRDGKFWDAPQEEKAAWREALHPRDWHGRFARGVGGLLPAVGGPSTQEVPVVGEDPRVRARRQKQKRKLAGVKKALGKNLIIEGDEQNPAVQTHLGSLTAMPVAFLRGLKRRRVKVYVSDQVVSKTDDLSHLAGVHPRGWPSGTTWDNCDGGAGPDRRIVYGSRSKDADMAGPYDPPELAVGARETTLPHEIGHLFGEVPSFGLGPQGDQKMPAKYKTPLQDTSEWKSLYRRAYEHLYNPYLKQGGPNGRAGREEAFATLFGELMLGGEDRARIEFGDEAVDWMKERIDEASA